MKGYIDSLNTRYQLIKESRDDKEFYMNVYHYIHVIETTPELKNIIDECATKFRETTTSIWDNPNLSNKEKSQLIFKLEKFSMYCFYLDLEMLIHFPINDYLTDPNPDNAQDPVALILTEGIENIKTQKYSAKWNKKTLNSYNERYKGHRKDFEHSLRQLHLMLLETLEKNTNDVSKTEKVAPNVPLKLNPRTGDFTFYKTRGNISAGTQEFKILSFLLYSKDFIGGHLSLYQALSPHITEVKKSQRDGLTQIIRNIKEKLEILPKTKTSNPDIFKAIPKVGYRLIFKDTE